MGSCRCTFSAALRTDESGTLNILQLALSLAPGGRRVVILNLVDQLKRLGHESCLGILGDQLESNDPNSETAVALNRQSLLDLRAIARLAEFCRNERVDMIHAHDAASQFVAALLCVRHPRSAPPALMTFHRSVGIESANFRDRLRNRFACAMTGAVVTVSDQRRRHFLEQNRVDPRKVVCIPNGIDVERYRPDVAIRAAVRRELGAGDDAVVIGAVGHFGREKGLDVVLRGFRELVALAGSADVRLVIAGQGAEQETRELEQIAAECGGRVTFLGQRRILRAGIRRSTCCCMHRARRPLGWCWWRRWRLVCRWWRREWAGFLRSYATARQAGWWRPSRRRHLQQRLGS